MPPVTVPGDDLTSSRRTMLGTIWSSCATSYQPRWRYSWSAGPWLLASDEPSVVPFLELFKMPPPRCSPAMAGSKHMGRVQRIWICHLPTSTLLSAGSTMLILLVIAAKDLRRRRMAKCSKRARARSPREKVAVNLTRSKGGNQHRLTRTRRRRRRRRRCYFRPRCCCFHRPRSGQMPRHLPLPDRRAPSGRRPRPRHRRAMNGGSSSWLLAS
mmetsp:Transcript_32116/g.94526  ORF Transcript_32116/g.94526 Transcript_32116/m.94526 type:complete len:213 (+) Transcript_32116:2956-3594(+)